LGASLGQIRRHILKEIPEVGNWGISDNTVARLFQPPNRTRSSSVLYKGLIDAKVPRKSDTLRKNNRNFHACRSQVLMAMEMGLDFHTECVVAGADGKAKVAVGKLAVSKFVKLRKIFPLGDSPKSLDHDFVIASCWSLSVDGIIVLEPQQNSNEPNQPGGICPPAVPLYNPSEVLSCLRLSSEEGGGRQATVESRARRAAIIEGFCSEDSSNVPFGDSSNGPSGSDDNLRGPSRPDEQTQLEAEAADDKPADEQSRSLVGDDENCQPIVGGAKRYLDRQGRQRVDIPSTGPLHLFIRPTRFNASSPYTHYQDLMQVVDKPNCVLSVDGGADYTCRSLKCNFWYWRLFRDKKMDSITVVQNAAGFSAFNYQIEHAWSWSNQSLVGVVLPGTLPEHNGVTPAEFHRTPACTRSCIRNKEDSKRKMAADHAPRRKCDKSRQTNKLKRITIPCLLECAAEKAGVQAQILEDEKKVFEEASRQLKGCWHKKLYDGFEVNCHVVSDTVSDEVPAETRRLGALLDEYMACKTPSQLLPGHRLFDIHQEVLLMMRHSVKTSHMISHQAQCGVQDCPHPNCHEEGTQMLKEMKRRKMPYFATEDPDHPGHNCVYLDLKEKNGEGQDAPDKHIRLERRPKPAFQPAICELGQVDRGSCARVYTFCSEAEKKRHIALYHAKASKKRRSYNVSKGSSKLEGMLNLANARHAYASTGASKY
jgi:hypothetical protein